MFNNCLYRLVLSRLSYDELENVFNAFMEYVGVGSYPELPSDTEMVALKFLAADYDIHRSISTPVPNASEQKGVFGAEAVLADA